MAEVQQDFAGLTYELTFEDEDENPIDFSSAETMEIHFELLDGTGLEKTLTPQLGDGSGSIWEYVSEADVHAQPGLLEYQAFVQDSSQGIDGHYPADSITVLPNLVDV